MEDGVSLNRQPRELRKAESSRRCWLTSSLITWIGSFMPTGLSLYVMPMISSSRAKPYLRLKRLSIWLSQIRREIQNEDQDVDDTIP